MGYFKRLVCIVLLIIFFSPIPSSLTPDSLAYAMARMPKDYQRPVRTTSAEPLTLKDCYQLALKRSEVVAIRKEDIEETQASFYTAAGQAIGNVDFVMTNFRQQRQRTIPGGNSFTEDSVGSTSNRPVRRERKFVIEQPVFQGFRTLASLSAAGSLTKEKREQRRHAEQQLFLEVARAFYNVHLAQKGVEVYEEIRKLYGRLVDDLTKREKIGRSRLSELVITKSRLKIHEAELAQARGDLANAKHVLAYLTGIIIEVPMLKDDVAPEEANRDLDSYLASVTARPDVKAAFQSVRSYRSGIVEAQSGLWPHMFLDYNHYEKREGFQSNTDWDALFTVDVPIFKGGETFGKIKESVSKWKKARYYYSQVEREAALEIQEAFEDWTASFDVVRAYDEAVAAAEENLGIVKKEYQQNLVSNLEVLNTLETFLNTKKDSVRSYYDMKQNYWRLQVAQGKTYESF